MEFTEKKSTTDLTDCTERTKDFLAPPPFAFLCALRVSAVNPAFLRAFVVNTHNVADVLRPREALDARHPIRSFENSDSETRSRSTRSG